MLNYKALISWKMYQLELYMKQWYMTSTKMVVIMDIHSKLNLFKYSSNAFICNVLMVHYKGCI